MVSAKYKYNLESALMMFRFNGVIFVIAISCLVLCMQTVFAAPNPKVAPKVAPKAAPKAAPNAAPNAAPAAKATGSAKSGNKDEITKTNEKIKASEQEVQKKLSILGGVVGFEDTNLGNTALLPKQGHQQETDMMKEISKCESEVKKKLDEFDTLRKEMVEVMPQSNNPALRKITEQYVQQTEDLLKSQQGETLNMLNECENKVKTLSDKLKTNAETLITSVKKGYDPVLNSGKGAASTSELNKPLPATSGSQNPAKAVGDAKKKASK